MKYVLHQIVTDVSCVGGCILLVGAYFYKPESEQYRESNMPTPLINEINSLVDTLHDLDNDEIINPWI